MARYIDIDKAEEDFFNIRCDGGCKCYPDGCDDCLIYEGAEFFIGYKTEDVRPVVHGEWIQVEDEEKKFEFQIVCSHCHKPNRYPTFNENDEAIQWTYDRTTYCPNCGAFMRSHLKKRYEEWCKDENN